MRSILVALKKLANFISFIDDLFIDQRWFSKEVRRYKMVGWVVVILIDFRIYKIYPSS